MRERGHDRTRLDAGLFHAIHLDCLVRLGAVLNNGGLPTDWYALLEHHSGKRLSHAEPAAGRPRTLTVRRVDGHGAVALVEMVCPVGRPPRHLPAEFVAKVIAAVNAGVHVTVLDLLPPGRSVPGGLSRVIWTELSGNSYIPPDKPLTFAAFKAGGPVEGFFTHLAVGDRVPDAQLFLTPAHYVNLPLAASYELAFRGLPEYWRQVLEVPAQPTS